MKTKLLTTLVAAGSFAVKSEIDAELPSERRVSVILAIHVALLGWGVSRQVVHQDHALKA